LNHRVETVFFRFVVDPRLLQELIVAIALALMNNRPSLANFFRFKRGRAFSKK